MSAKKCAINEKKYTVKGKTKGEKQKK